MRVYQNYILEDFASLMHAFKIFEFEFIYKKMRPTYCTFGVEIDNEDGFSDGDQGEIVIYFEESSLPSDNSQWRLGKNS